MKVLSVVGARTNFMKVAPIIAAIVRRNGKDALGFEEPAITIQHVLVHTGQHYDDLMSGSFFSDLSLPRPDVHLGVIRERSGGREARYRGCSRGCQFDARLFFGCRKAVFRFLRHQALNRPCRSGIALLRSFHARRNQPHCHRSSVRLAVCHRGERGNESL